MTITEDFGSFKAKLRHNGAIGCREREVDIKVTWVSCGVFQLEYYRPRDAEKHYVLVTEDWYPPDTFCSFTPEQFEKVVELYPSAPKHKRDEAYKPFYEEYTLDGGMFDFEHDRLFQAYKDPHPELDMVYLVNHYFQSGAPETNNSVLGLYMDDFKKLKDLIDSQKHLIFYSGCKIAMPSKTITDLQNALSGESS